MKFCIAQTKPIKGNIESNIVRHEKLIEIAIENSAEVIIFPELSLTGYEPTLAHSLAIHPQDNRLTPFQELSDEKGITIGVGIPVRNDGGICISMIVFQPHHSRMVYSKEYLHPDEEDFFIPGKNIPVLKVDTTNMALAICYEISVPQHVDQAFNHGAEIYIASVAKFERGIDAALKRLSEIAYQKSAIVMMANCVGNSDGNICAGKSTVCNKEGKRIAELNAEQEGIIVVDTGTETAIERMI